MNAAMAAFFLAVAPAFAQPSLPVEFIRHEIAVNEGLSGIYVLEKGADALVARAWLADNALESIDVQYFIWSTDNIGILAMEALLRAAERGVRVRIIVDDLLIKAPDKSLLALAFHPNIEIKIYNPKLSVGVPMPKRLLNVLTDFRDVNQRMHNKAMIVDGHIAIVGGRNMAAEYFDYNQKYNFRDRDVLLLGPVVKDIASSFQQYWDTPISVAVEERYDGFGLLKKNVRVRDAEAKRIYAEMHDYARSPQNFPEEVRRAIADVPNDFSRIANFVVWDDIRFVADAPGKNEAGWRGGGVTTGALAELVKGAQRQVVIQSPYLVLSSQAMALFRATRERGVSIRISTNSLASTDNLPAFSGYRNQRDELLAMGVEIFEYKPNPEIEQALVQRLVEMKEKPPVFALHAKTMIVDGETVYIGTYNLDPRSENLNTELGIILKNATVARTVQSSIELDMQPGNSWNAAKDAPDGFAGMAKRTKVRTLQVMPLQPLL